MENINPIFLNLSLILIVAGVTTLIFKYLKQPLVLGYIVAGFITGPNFKFFPTVLDQNIISVWGEIGVVFLMFALGLDFNIKKIKKVGPTGATTAISEALIMMTVGLIAGRLMGWSTMNSLFLGGMLSISSTAIIIKAFDDLKLKNRRFSQIALGALVFEDLVAILLLVILSTIAVSKQFNGNELLLELFKLLLFLGLWFTGGIYLIPTLLRKLKRLINEETLLVVSLGLCLGMVVMAAESGFSPALGAFLMGAIMAETDEVGKIHKLISPIRTLFASVFFISVGMLVDPIVLVDYIIPILIITLIVLIIKPIAATIGFILSGQTIKQSMESGFCLCQIGEFSFIIATLGLSLNVIDAYLYPVIVSVSVITTFATPYFIRFADPFYEKIYASVPDAWRTVIHKIGTDSVSLEKDSSWKKLLKAYGVRLFMHSAWIIAILFCSFQFFIPHVLRLLGGTLWVEVVLSFITLVAMSPFLYALMIKPIEVDLSKKMWADAKYARGPLLALQLSRYVLGALYIVAVIGRLLSLHFAVLIPVVVLIVVAISMSRRIKTHYHNIEVQFLENLDKTAKHSGIIIPNHLTNDIYMEYVDIDANSDLIGKSIRQIHREYHTGVQVISINRHNRLIRLPFNTESLFSGDRLLVVGNDSQISQFKSLSEAPENESLDVHFALPALNLYKVIISEDSLLCGERSNISEIRNKFGFLLVGCERSDKGFLRPESDVVFNAGDTLWIVGEKIKLMDVI